MCVRPELDFQTRKVMNILITAESDDDLGVIFTVWVWVEGIGDSLRFSHTPPDSC